MILPRSMLNTHSGHDHTFINVSWINTEQVHAHFFISQNQSHCHSILTVHTQCTQTASSTAQTLTNKILNEFTLFNFTKHNFIMLSWTKHSMCMTLYIGEVIKLEFSEIQFEGASVVLHVVSFSLADLQGVSRYKKTF